MHETRNFVLVVALIACVIWALCAWLLFDPAATLLPLQRYGTLALIVILGGWLAYALLLEDKLPDYLREKIGPMY